MNKRHATRALINRVLNATPWAFAALFTVSIIGTTSVQSSAGICSISPSGTYVEAEHFTQMGSNFLLSNAPGGASGTGYIRAALDDTSHPPTPEPVGFELNFSRPGTYYLAVRGKSVNRDADSIWYGINGVATGNISLSKTGHWAWGQRRKNYGMQMARIELKAAGSNTINFWAMDSDFKLDGFYLSMSSDIPGGNGKSAVPASVLILNPLDPFSDSCGAEVADSTDSIIIIGENSQSGSPVTVIETYKPEDLGEYIE